MTRHTPTLRCIAPINRSKTYFITCLRDIGSDRKWVSFAAIGVVTILMAGRDYDQPTLSLIIAAVFAVAMMLTIGALFETDLAIALRQLAAASLVASAAAVVVWHFTQAPGIRSYALLAGLSAVSVIYMQIVRRLGWLYVFGLQSACLVVLVGWTGYDAGAITGSNWPIPSGLVCFAIGLTITSMKTGVHHRLRRHLPRQLARLRYRSGL